MSVIGKAELVDRLATATGLDPADAARAVGVFLDCIGEALRAGEVVRLTSFGTFRIVDTRGREVMNPRTREPIVVPPGRRVLFSASARLRGPARPGGKEARPPDSALRTPDTRSVDDLPGV